MRQETEFGKKRIPEIEKFHGDRFGRFAEFLEQNLPQGSTLGFDGRTVSGDWWEKARERLRRKQIKLEGNLDLAGQVWEDRPPLLARPVWILDEKYAGKSAAEEKKEQSYFRAVYTGGFSGNCRGNMVYNRNGRQISVFGFPISNKNRNNVTYIYRLFLVLCERETSDIL